MKPEVLTYASASPKHATWNTEMLRPYLKRVFDVAQQGDAREESYYSALEGLLDEYAKSVGKKNIHITTLPKKTEAGNPDFRVWDGKQHITGYIEAKAPENVDLDTTEDTEQLTRYRRTFPNLILTNFLEFRLYRDGNLTDKVSIARPFVLHQLKKQPPAEKESEFLNLLEKFFSYSFPRLYDAEKLAVELAKRTRFLRDEVVAQQLREEEQTGRHFIYGFYEAFKKYLIAGLDTQGFADLYSQTITYGLFAASTRSGSEFNRKLAYDSIPHTIGILRDVFKFISLEDLPPQMEWILDDISEVLAVTDVQQILHRFFQQGKGRDPIVHFYETFLAEYDPATRKRRGVYYTPESVVSYIVRSLHSILKQHFGIQDGLAADSVTVLDPAAGTLTFLAEAAKQAVHEFVSKYGEGGRSDFIREHVLRNFFAFELMMAPYAVGHLKMSFLLDELGYKLQENDRIKFYLTNTLEMEELAQTELPGMSSLSEESHLAARVKKDTPILVILGNPPYSGIPANVSERETLVRKGQPYITHYQIKEDQARGCHTLIPQTAKATREIKKRQKTWIGKLIEHYKIVDGQWLNERTAKWLQDDYVKFIRFGQWKIDMAGKGVLAFITNHSYLDNPTFRGMRQSLMNSFSEIYILDLHGNRLKKEKCPDGSKDANVFDIQPGVAIAIFIKTPGQTTQCRVYHSEIWGSREYKNRVLLENDVDTTKWEQVSPKPDFYLFRPRDEKLSDFYEKQPKITEIFPHHGVGMTTARDSFVIDKNKNTLINRIRLFKNSKYHDEDLHKHFQINVKKGWSIRKAWNALQPISDSELGRYALPILYRPFDPQWIFYHDSVVWRTVKRIMYHMMQQNLALCVGRAGQVVGLEKPWNIVFCADCLVDFNLFYRGGNMNFPLYLYPAADKQEPLPHGMRRIRREANINPKLLAVLTEAYEEQPTPDDIFYYVYAVLYSNTYRNRYRDFLKIDFPRIPFAKSHRLVSQMSRHGKELVELHHLRSPRLQEPIAKFQGEGNRVVKTVKYDANAGEVHVNQNQYFEGISEEVWDYRVGGYQVCSKWLKDRKGRKLSIDEIKQYCRIVTALKKTIEIQKSIDEIYPEVEKKTIEFDLG